METPMTAVEMSGIVDENNQLRLEGSLPIKGPKRVRVIVLTSENDEFTEAEWLKAASRNIAFDFLNDPAEDVYTRNDGQPFHDEE
jgi:hypothetical protein